MENVTLLAVVEAAEKPKAPRTLPTTKSSNEPSIQVKFISAGLAACFADLVTFPLDTAKVRLQIQGESVLPTGSGHLAAAANSTASKNYRGVIGTICTIARQEGPKALYNGLAPGLQRQMCFASVRIGLYDSVKQTYSKKLQALGVSNGSGGIGVRLLAGCTTGGMAVLCAQPTDVVKVRMQAQKAGVPARYTGVMAAYRTIAVQEGIRGLWKGTSPNVLRNCVVNCAELVSYDLIKEKILSSGLLSDNLPCHFVSAFGAGFFTTIIGSPVDVIKTRFMNSGAGTYSGVVDCAVKMFQQEGPTAFYKGFMPSFMRLASWNIVMFVGYEQLKRQLSSSQKMSHPMPAIEIKPSAQRYM